MISRLEKIFLEPVNTLTHLIAALAALIGLVMLTVLTIDSPAKMISLLIYGVCQLLLYVASSLLHGVRTTPKWNFFLNRLDHMAIFFMIAGVYTPIAYNLFPSPWQTVTLGLVWGFALLGALFKLFRTHIHGFFNAAIYLFMSWGVALFVGAFLEYPQLFSPRGIVLLLAGGVVYSVGFVVYYFEWPDPWPSVMGHHEIWHLFVMGGSLFHFLFMLWEIVPA